MSERIIDREVSPESKTVDIGSIVKIHYENDPEGYTETIQIVRKRTIGETATGIQEASIDTPIGHALLGQTIDNVISFTVPEVGEIRVQIIDIY